MVDYRSRAERRYHASVAQRQEQEAKSRQVAIQEDHRQALAKMNDIVADRLSELEQKTHAVATHSSETRDLLNSQVTALNDEISTVHQMIRAGAEADMEMIEQMARNNERRLQAILQLIRDI